MTEWLKALTLILVAIGFFYLGYDKGYTDANKPVVEITDGKD